jgi:CHAD domain-containing protein
VGLALLREYVVEGDEDALPIEAMCDALSARAEPRRTERRSWIDTFDWRLYNAGLVLEHQRRGGESALVLSDRDGQRVARVPVGDRAEAAVDELPEGPIRDQISTLAGPRALFARATVDGPVTLLSALDGEEKTVARVAVEGPLTVEGGDALPPRVRVETLRGYPKEARTAAKRLAGLRGLATADDSLFEAACAVSGLRPGVYRSKPDVDIDPTLPANEAFAILLGELLDIARVNVDGTLRQLDTEFLHDLRVAVRRGRAALKMAKGVFDEPARSRHAAELKWIGDITTPSRDLDVYLLGFDEMVERALDPDAVRPFHTLLVRKCRKAHTALNRALRSQRFGRLLEDWPGDLAAADQLGPEADRPIADVATDRLRRAWRRVHKRGSAITDASPAESLHDLRKRCKELRYLLELFAGLYTKSAHKEVVGELKQLQDNLGAFQDAEAQRFLILEYAEELAEAGVPAATLIAMGRLDEHFERRQSAARAEFAERWSRFDRRHNERVFTRMLGAR